ncbi:MAG: potassium-transporting ATPase subunit KdpA [Candidatus Margulisiibacteriota bacterium]|jgi:K+-transporting ATPase ATPase A chain
MNNAWVFELVIFLLLLITGSVFLGRYMALVFTSRSTFLTPIIRPLEKFLYYILGINENEEMTWQVYAKNIIILSVLSIAGLFLIQKFQQFLPFNPQQFPGVRFDTALNTAVSFVTNTNWQCYSGEASLSYFTQMAGLAVQNFLSAAVGLAAAIAFIRAFVPNLNKEKPLFTLGNFWVDLTRSILYILLPLSILFSMIFVSQGVIQNFHNYVKVKTFSGYEQVIPGGPAASQIAIKHIGTNGGGFFNANSTHPFENPTPVTDFLQIFGLLIIAAALPFTLGSMLKKPKLGWVIFMSMFIIYLLGLSVFIYAEFKGNPILHNLGLAPGISMEGKEVRISPLSNVLFAHSTTSTSCGAVNSMHDSLMPLSGLILIFNMALGEIVFGGVGTGLIGLLLYVMLTMFIVGLMIGRTAEIFGKKLEPFEMIMAIVAILTPSIIQLCFGAIAVSTKVGVVGLNNLGPHGLSEIIYAFASGAGNNGSAFAGLSANTLFYNLTLAFAMLCGRFVVIIPALAIAGALIKKKFVPDSVQFPTQSPVFIVMLIGVILIVGALTFFPILTLGPILEHLYMHAGKIF